jgi:hypothetical protein
MGEVRLLAASGDGGIFCAFTFIRVSYIVDSCQLYMTDLIEVRALVSALERLMGKHPELNTEMQSIFEEEVRLLRLKTLERQLSLHS